MSERPDRAHLLTIRIGGDTTNDVIDALREILADLRAGAGLRTFVVGGVASGYVAEYTHDPTMTHDRYIAELNAYLMEKDGRTN